MRGLQSSNACNRIASRDYRMVPGTIDDTRACLELAQDVTSQFRNNLRIRPDGGMSRKDLIFGRDEESDGDLHVRSLLCVGPSVVNGALGCRSAARLDVSAE